MATVQKCRQKQLVFLWYHQASLKINSTAVVSIDDKLPSLVNENFQHVFRRFKVRWEPKCKEKNQNGRVGRYLLTKLWTIARRFCTRDPCMDGVQRVFVVHFGRFKKKEKKGISRKKIHAFHFGFSAILTRQKTRTDDDGRCLFFVFVFCQRCRFDNRQIPDVNPNRLASGYF